MAGSLQDAANRRRLHVDVIHNMRHPVESPYTFIDVGTGAAGMVPEAETNDLVRLADAMVAELDPSPVGAEWLLLMGATDIQLREHEKRWAKNRLVFSVPHRKRGIQFDIAIDDFVTVHLLDRFGRMESVEALEGKVTRGQLRTLCRALGIPLTEESSARNLLGDES